MTTIVDTDTIFALSNPTDALHARATALVERLADITVLLSPTTLAEFSLTAARKLGLAHAKAAVREITQGPMQLVVVDAQDIQAATTLFYQQKRIENSLCDCFVMALAKRYNADCIFSFDGGYSDNGFVLAEDFLQARHPKSGR
jgi:predicted nucleic acid-binding protein